jgi:hypothetical protein
MSDHHSDMQRQQALTITSGSPVVPYEQHQEQRSPIVGRLLKFNGRGRESFYSYKQADTGVVVKLPIGTKLVVNLEEAKRGVTIWGLVEGKQRPIVQIVGNALDRAWRDPGRDQLGNHDRSLWPIGLSGQREDPVKYTKWLYLKEPGSDQIFTYTSDSFGGNLAFRNLVDRYQKLLVSHPKNTAACHLIIALNETTMASKFGEILRPKFEICDEWESKQLFAEAMAAAIDLDDDRDTVGQDGTAIAPSEAATAIEGNRDELDHALENAGGTHRPQRSIKISMTRFPFEQQATELPEPVEALLPQEQLAFK